MFEKGRVGWPKNRLISLLKLLVLWPLEERKH